MEFFLAAGSDSVAAALRDIFIVLLAAKLGDELFRHIRQPVVAGEILAGVLIGPSLLGLAEPSDVLEVMSELGVVFILFWVGLHMRASEMKAVGRQAFSVGILGVVIPVAGGIAAGYALGYDTSETVFLGAALAATSAGITSAVLIELKLLTGRAGRTILGAAIVDDILALILLAVAVGLAGTGVSVGSTLLVVGLAIGFIGFVGLGGSALFARRPQILEAPRFAESPLLPAVLLCLGLAVVSAEIGLAAIIGAFLAGMVVAETKEQTAIESEIAPLYAFFSPFFFALIGMTIVTSELGSLSAILLLIGITVLAASTKYAGASIGARGMNKADRHFVAVGMIPRGEVGIIIASIGRAEGVISDELFAVIVAMALATTLMAPPILRRIGPATKTA